MKKPLTLLIGVTVTAIALAQAPPETNKLNFSGFLQYRTEWTQNPRVTAPEAGLAYDSDLGPADKDSKNESRTLLWLNVDNQFDGHTRFHALINSEALGGRSTGDWVKVWEAYAEAKLGPGSLAVGRFLSDVGLGTLGGAPFMDGAHAALATDKVKAQVYLTKFGGPGQGLDYNVADKSTYTFLMGDVKVTPVQGLTLSAAYFSDITTKDPAANVVGGSLYQSWALGAEYCHMANGAPQFTLSGEYADNSAAMARKINGTAVPYATADCTEGSDPKAYFVKAQVLGANPGLPGTAGGYIQYRKADAGFDAMAMASPRTWNAPYNWTCPAEGGIADNQKGVEVGAEITVLPRCILKVAYGAMKLVNTTSTLDLGSPALAVVSSVVPTGGAPIVNTVTGAQNKTSQNYGMASVLYIF
jgi:hypothetical protein